MNKLAFVFLVMVMAAPTFAAGRPISFCDVCAGYTISKKGDDVLIRCPGMAEPWMTLKDCKNPKAKRTGTTLTITCG